MQRRVLIVSPHFPPINAADHQRVRMALPYLQEFGWQPHVLAVQPEAVQGVCDPYLQSTIPKDIPITYIKALPVQYTKILGLSNLGWRCLPYLIPVGDKLLREKSFDLIYFSTTVFLSMGLAARWFKKFGIPYILDFQDPWLSDYYQQEGKEAIPPGGRLKYGFAQLMARYLEPSAMQYVHHVTSVSSAYPEILQQRYPWLKSKQFSVLPFGAPEADFKLLPTLNIKQSIFDPNDGKIHWVYVGRGGADMAKALEALFRAIQVNRSQNPQLWKSVKLHFVGTSYAPKGRETKTIEPIAVACGVEDLVTEHPLRIPYFEALQILKDSNGILLIGSNDPNYSASKIYPCILAQKPILGIFHEQSLVVDVIEQTQAGEVVTFRSEDESEDLIKALTAKINQLFKLSQSTPPNINWSAFQPYTARNMTEKLCQIFNQYALS
ncbi:hypothetical protein Sta7437_2231 [Stanieria cyanosphaera PCC 7437]|uniref:Glycosyltransferase subfamily 4-like N-terminal domain-containing protein n=1 Tax=Stanieria cyanosphaera (strain ATCC 29371 / PCC 7437) TaxID=111780 RepID=K9XUP0_STAC7|nr:hypothetical protein [Stanieria cyanosphaera]AFZ35779.1 hypothetical protein Sta7437_2231 [Stanieria cyanosphaera PCC 7437]